MTKGRSLSKNMRRPGFWEQPTGHLNEHGQPETLRSALAAMVRDGVDPRLIDRWIGGFCRRVAMRGLQSAAGTRCP